VAIDDAGSALDGAGGSIGAGRALEGDGKEKTQGKRGRH